MPLQNLCTIGGKPILNPSSGSGFVNWFASGTGAGKYGHGLFLMLPADYDEVSTAASDGTSTLVLKDHRGASLSIPVFVLSAMPWVSKGGTVGESGVVAVRVADKRYGQVSSITKYFNAQAGGFTYDSATPKFLRDTLNGGSEYTWADLLTAIEAPSLPSALTSWKPRNIAMDGWHRHRAIDWVASELFVVVGWNDTTSEFSYHNPGTRTAENSDLANGAKGLLAAGGEGKRNVRRLPANFSVKFKAAANTYSTNRIYSKTVAVGGGASTQPLHAGGYIATRSASTWLEQSSLDAVAADLAARAYAFLSVTPAAYEYKGIVPFKPDGAIREILWMSNGSGATTKIMQGCRFDWAQSANGGLWGFADPSMPGMQPRVELPSDQLIVGLGGTNTSIGPSGTRYILGGPPMVRVYITAAASGGGKYDGKILPEPATAPAATGDLAQADLGGTAGTECLVLNMQETGGSTHWLTDGDNTNQKTFLGMLDGATSGGVPIVYIGGLWAEACE